MKDYSKYIYSTGTHYISNSGSDEKGGARGGKAGDQTGNEWKLRSWYDRPWAVVLRYPNADARKLFAELSCAAALNNNVGYDQGQRTTYDTQLQKTNDPEKIEAPCESDCTAGVTANWRCVGRLMGIEALANLDRTTYSGNMRSRFKKAGFEVLTDAKYIGRKEYLLPGDVLLYDGHHACANVTKGKYAVDTAYKYGDRNLKYGCMGEDVRELQMRLIERGYDLGAYGADGDWGDCTEIGVRDFQKDNGLKVTGIFDADCFAAMEKEPEEPADALMVKIFGGNCYVRTAPNTSGKILGTAHRGDVLQYGGQTSENGWNLVSFNDENGWVSGKYSRCEGVKK